MPPFKQRDAHACYAYGRPDLLRSSNGVHLRLACPSVGLPICPSAIGSSSCAGAESSPFLHCPCFQVSTAVSGHRGSVGGRSLVEKRTNHVYWPVIVIAYAICCFVQVLHSSSHANSLLTSIACEQHYIGVISMRLIVTSRPPIHPSACPSMPAQPSLLGHSRSSLASGSCCKKSISNFLFSVRHGHRHSYSHRCIHICTDMPVAKQVCMQ